MISLQSYKINSKASISTYEYKHLTSRYTKQRAFHFLLWHVNWRANQRTRAVVHTYTNLNEVYKMRTFITWLQLDQHETNQQLNVSIQFDCLPSNQWIKPSHTRRSSSSSWSTYLPK